MRIRQIRPEFFTDPVTAHLPAPVQVTYIGLWCVADDAGWLTWDVPQLGALLYPYMSVRVREALIGRAAEMLQTGGRLRLLDCGCAFIPTLAVHQKNGGTKAVPVLERHRVHTNPDTYGFSASNVTVSNGRVGNGTPERATPDGALGERLIASGMDPAIVKGRPS